MKVSLPQGSIGGAGCCGCAGGSPSLIYIYAVGVLQDAYACNGCDCTQIALDSPYQIPPGEGVGIALAAGGSTPESICGCCKYGKVYDVPLGAQTLSLSEAWDGGKSIGYLESKYRALQAENAGIANELRAVAGAADRLSALNKEQAAMIADLRDAVDIERARNSFLQGELSAYESKGKPQSEACDVTALIDAILVS